MLKPFSYIKDLCNTEPDENHNNNSDPDEETGGLLDDTYSDPDEETGGLLDDTYDDK